MAKLPYMTSDNTPSPHIVYGCDIQGNYTDIWNMFDGNPNTYGRATSPEGEFRSRFYRGSQALVLQWSFVKYAVTVRSDGINTPKFWVLGLYHPIHGNDYTYEFFDRPIGYLVADNWWIADIQENLSWTAGERKEFTLVEPMPIAKELVFEFHYGRAVDNGWWSGDQWGLNIVDIASIELYIAANIWVKKSGVWEPVTDIWAYKSGVWQPVSSVDVNKDGWKPI